MKILLFSASSLFISSLAYAQFTKQCEAAIGSSRQATYKFYEVPEVTKKIQPLIASVPHISREKLKEQATALGLESDISENTILFRYPLEESQRMRYGTVLDHLTPTHLEIEFKGNSTVYLRLFGIPGGHPPRFAWSKGHLKFEDALLLRLKLTQSCTDKELAMVTHRQLYTSFYSLPSDIGKGSPLKQQFY